MTTRRYKGQAFGFTESQLLKDGWKLQDVSQKRPAHMISSTHGPEVWKQSLLLAVTPCFGMDRK